MDSLENVILRNGVTKNLSATVKILRFAQNLEFRQSVFIYTMKVVILLLQNNAISALGSLFLPSSHHRIAFSWSGMLTRTPSWGFSSWSDWTGWGTQGRQKSREGSLNSSRGQPLPRQHPLPGHSLVS